MKPHSPSAMPMLGIATDIANSSPVDPTISDATPIAKSKRMSALLTHITITTPGHRLMEALTTDLRPGTGIMDIGTPIAVSHSSLNLEIAGTARRVISGARDMIDQAIAAEAGATIALAGETSAVTIQQGGAMAAALNIINPSPRRLVRLRPARPGHDRH